MLPHLPLRTLSLLLLLLRLQVDPQFFAFRWITLLLTQEFSFPDAVRIWDALLADPGGRLDCLLRVCLALLINVRQQLLAGGCSFMLGSGCWTLVVGVRYA
jgi:hypothetical protein